MEKSIELFLVSKHREIAQLISRADNPTYYPLSFSQQRLWFLSQLNTNDITYNVPNIFSLTGELNLQFIQLSFQTILQRHDILRTIFKINNGEPQQCVINQSICSAIDIIFIDLVDPEVNLNTNRDDILYSIISKPFNLAEDLLIRLYILKLTDKHHILVLNIHHIICDGWSIRIFFDELQRLYNAFTLKQSPNLAEVEFQYREYAEQQIEQYKANAFNNHLIFWENSLAKIPEAMNLPTDFPRSHHMIFFGEQITYIFPIDFCKKIEIFAKNNKLTTFTIFLATFYIVLARYSNQNDIVIGIPLANRNKKSLNNMIGLLTNLVPLRVCFSEDFDFIRLLDEVRKITTQALQYQDVPFEKIVEEIQPKRSLNISPIFQAMFVKNVSGESFGLNGLDIEAINLPLKTAKFDISLYIQENGDMFTATLEYNADIFLKSSVENILDYWSNLLVEIIANPFKKLWQISSLLSKKNKSILLPEKDVFNSQTQLFDLFNQQVLKHPNQIALFENGNKISFSELNELVNKIANYLILLDEPRTCSVGVFSERNFEQVATILAIFKVGHVYVPINPHLPSNRIETILNEAKVKYIIFADLIVNELLENVNGICPIYLKHVLTQTVDVVLKPKIELKQESPAYIIFTSGSSGIPKGTIGTHQGLLNRLNWAWKKYAFHANEICCLQASIMFVDSMAELFAPILAGIPTLILTEEEVKDPHKLVNTLTQHNVTRILMVPSLLKLVIDSCKILVKNLPTLKLWIVSGEILPTFIADDFFKIFPNRMLVNLYGSSEVAADVTYYELTKSHPYYVPIGRPIDNMRVYLLDEYLQLVPPGVIGEIYISGVGLALGYCNHLDLTAATFIPDLYNNIAGQRMYRTGDYAQLLPSGQLRFHGRKDFQIKIRGIRIELEEIESCIKQLPGVHQVIVLSEGGHEQAKLIAYIVCDIKTDLLNLKNLLKIKLPDYLIPNKFLRVEELPRTINGKISRDPATFKIYENTDLASEYLTFPQTDLENKIKTIWQEVLKAEQIGLKENFFDAGGHSLLLVELRNQLVNQLGYHLTIMDLFQYPTISDLSLYLSGLESNQENKSIKNVIHREQQDIAIVGLAGRFPGASSMEEFWDLLANENQGLKRFVSDTKKDSPYHKHVNIDSGLAEIENFDAHFFNMKQAEAEILDPQHRILLECAWEALENAGYNPDADSNRIGIYAGTAQSTYLLLSLLPQLNLKDINKLFSVFISNNENFLATRVAYKLNLRGPAVSLQTACSSSLVAVHMAAQSLLTGEADIMLAGGVTVKVPQGEGYLYQQGSIVSPDGVCRAFDQKANGTVFANGAGLVVLKRLSDAIATGDSIYGIIKGSAINNDGHDKAGYVAPSIQGQADVIHLALQNAQVSPETISYIEAHGTGTVLGDQIEISALKQVFKNVKDGICGIGSVKTNIGHLDAAAGVASLIKVILSLKHKQLPASLNCKDENELLQQSNRFYLVKKTTPWLAKKECPRRAGISSFGIGGTNAHIIIEEPPEQVEAVNTDKFELIVLSARTETSLITIRNNLANYLCKNSNYAFQNIAYTLQVGRKAFEYRWSAVCAKSDLLPVLHSPLQQYSLSNSCELSNKCLVLVLGGSLYENKVIGKGLYENISSLQKIIDQCIKVHESISELKIKDIIFENVPANSNSEIYQAKILWNFIVEYAIAKFSQTLFAKNSLKIYGYGFAMFATAIFNNALSLKDALQILELRSQLGYLFLNKKEAMDTFSNDELIIQYKTFLDKIYQPEKQNILFPIEDWLCEIYCLQNNESENWQQEEQMCQQQINSILSKSSSTDSTIGNHANQIINLWEESKYLDSSRKVFSIFQNKLSQADEFKTWLQFIGKVWCEGVDIDWEYLNEGEIKKRIALPTYPFERQFCWIKPRSFMDDILLSNKEKTSLQKEDNVYKSRPQLDTPYIEPQNEIQQQLSEVWQQILELESVGINDNFFTLGGDSLLATQVISILKDIFPVEIPLDRFLENPTLIKLAELIDELIIIKISSMDEAEVEEFLLEAGIN